VKTLGYPQAALLAFSLAVLAYNCLACVKAALASQHGWDKVDSELSMFHTAQEVKRTYEGMCIAVPDQEWLPYGAMSSKDLAVALQQIAAHVNWSATKNRRAAPRNQSERNAEKVCM
jgi:hypothetical protein